jgi:hypothetical protein
MNIDTTSMCSHLQKKLFEEDGIYHSLWTAMQDDSELTARAEYDGTAQPLVALTFASDYR